MLLRRIIPINFQNGIKQISTFCFRDTDYRGIFRLYVRHDPAGDTLHFSKKLIDYYKSKNTHADSVLVMAESSRGRNAVLWST